MSEVSLDAPPRAELPDRRPAPRSGTSRKIRRALGFARPHRRAVLVIAVLTLLVAGVNAVEPLVLKYVFDGLAGGDGARSLVVGVGVLLAISVLREVVVAWSNWRTWNTRLRLQFALLEATIGRLHRMPLALQRSEGVGAILTRLDRSLQGFIGAVTELLFNVFPAVLYLVISVGIMVRLDWRLALLVLAFTPLPALIAALAAPEQTTRQRILMDRWARIYARFNEVLSGLVTVRSFSMEDAEKARFLRDVRATNKVVIRGVRRDSSYGAASNAVVTLARVAVIGFGGWLVVRGQATVGTLVAVLGYVGGLFGPVQGLSGIYGTLRQATVALDEIFSILDLEEQLADAPDALELDEVRGDVEFDDVTFSYEPGERPLLDSVSFRARAGETVAIVGPSGSGKTTLMALLMRFYAPDRGAIRLDGRDLRTLTQDSVRRHIAVVLQDPLLFNDTVRNNIAYGRPDATDAEVEAAARAANAHDFIMRLPDGYDTPVGERGSRLSVGERQRLSIARALIKNAGIIVLDEATASLDAESEALVQDALDTLMRGRTTFVIAHRLATVVDADQILVLQQGRITERGRHRDLLEAGGYYASLVARQTRGLIRNDAVPTP
ncbi:MAG TPA: ABC transporter ATP-binding protein [Pseudomonadales bacterium]